MPKFSDKQLQLMTFAIATFAVAVSFYLHHSFAWLPVMLVVTTSVNAPKIKASLLKTNKLLAIISFLGLAASMVSYPWVSQPVFFAIFFVGNLPMFLSFDPRAQMELMKAMGMKVPELKTAKVFVQKPPRDPAKPMTNTRRRELARLASGKKRKKH